MSRTATSIAFVLLAWCAAHVLAACEAPEPFMPDGMRCATSLDCPRGMCSMGTCGESGYCMWSGIGCGDGGGADSVSCRATEDCPQDACGRQTYCVGGYCGELQRPCDDAAP